MANRVLACNGKGILGSHDSDLVEERISNGLLDLLDLLNGLVMGEPVEKEIDIRSRAELLMVVLAQPALGRIEFLGDGQKTVHDG